MERKLSILFLLNDKNQLFMIVKVQISQFSSDGIKYMFFYNRSRSIMEERNLTEEVLKAMKGRAKAFFKVNITPDSFSIIEEVPDQDW